MTVTLLGLPSFCPTCGGPLPIREVKPDRDDPGWLIVRLDGCPRCMNTPTVADVDRPKKSRPKALQVNPA